MTTKSSPRLVGMVLCYNNASLLPAAKRRIPNDLFADIFVSDDGSLDDSVRVAKSLGWPVQHHEPNRGYGGNVKAALVHAFDNLGADYAVEIHGDGAQFDPEATRTALPLLQHGSDLVLGSRFQNKQTALKNGMPLVRFAANIGLSSIDRWVLGLSLTEFHTGFRIYSRRLYERVPWQRCNDDYLFSFEIIAQTAFAGLTIDEVPVAADYLAPHTSHAIKGAAWYAIRHFGVLGRFVMAKNGWLSDARFPSRA